MLLRSAIEGETEWGIGIAGLGGSRESWNEACRSIGRRESSEGRERCAELHERLLLLLLLLLLCRAGRLGGVGTGEGINERFFGPAFALVVEK